MNRIECFQESVIKPPDLRMSLYLHGTATRRPRVRRRVVTICNLTARCRAAPLRVNQTNERINRKANKNAERKLICF